MTPSIRGNLAKAWAVALLALLAGALGAPREARAGCDHGVTSRSDRLAVHRGHFDLLAEIGAIPRPAPEGPGAPQVPGPCSSCSERPVPAPASPQSAPLRSPPWIWRGITLAIAPATSATLPPEGDDLPLPRAGSSIFHPPRPSLPLTR